MLCNLKDKQSPYFLVWHTSSAQFLLHQLSKHKACVHTSLFCALLQGCILFPPPSSITWWVYFLHPGIYQHSSPTYFYKLNPPPLFFFFPSTPFTCCPTSLSLFPQTQSHPGYPATDYNTHISSSAQKQQPQATLPPSSALSAMRENSNSTRGQPLSWRNKTWKSLRHQQNPSQMPSRSTPQAIMCSTLSYFIFQVRRSLTSLKLPVAAFYLLSILL